MAGCNWVQLLPFHVQVWLEKPVPVVALPPNSRSWLGGGVEDHRGPGAGRGTAGGVMERPSGPGAGPGVAEYRARAPAAEQDQFVLGRVVGECRPLPAPWRDGRGPGRRGVAVARRAHGGLGGRRGGHRGHGQRGTRRSRGEPVQAAAYCEHRGGHLTSSARCGSSRTKDASGCLLVYSGRPRRPPWQDSRIGPEASGCLVAPRSSKPVSRAAGGFDSRPPPLPAGAAARP